ASQADAFVSHQSGSDVWSIGSANLEVVFGFNASRTLALQRIFNPSNGRSWDVTAAPDVGLTAGTERLTLTSTGAVSFLSAVAETTPHGVTLAFSFEHRALKLQITRVYAAY